MKPIYELVNTLKKEIDENNGVAPDKYREIAGVLILVLNFAKVFTPQKIDIIIDEIVKVLKLIENG